MSRVRNAGAWITLGGLFAKELALSVKDVAWSVLHPGRVQCSGIVAVPLDVRSDSGVSLLANLVTLTPGTTSLHVSHDRSTLYVHVMNLTPDVAQQIKRGFERRVMEVLP
jgi:multicomponent Na+:H+ antiporter subunit E